MFAGAHFPPLTSRRQERGTNVTLFLPPPPHPPLSLGSGVTVTCLVNEILWCEVGGTLHPSREVL